jgi:hypothetical protein
VHPCHRKHSLMRCCHRCRAVGGRGARPELDPLGWRWPHRLHPLQTAPGAACCR